MICESQSNCGNCQNDFLCFGNCNRYLYVQKGNAQDSFMSVNNYSDSFKFLTEGMRDFTEEESIAYAETLKEISIPTGFNMFKSYSTKGVICPHCHKILPPEEFKQVEDYNIEKFWNQCKLCGGKYSVDVRKVYVSFIDKG